MTPRTLRVLPCLRRTRPPRRIPAFGFVLATVAAAVTARAAEPALPAAAPEAVPGAPAKPPVPPDDPAVQARLPGCAVWTDHCVTCEHEAGGISCSNIGIACQPQAVECVRSETADGEKEKKEDGSKKPEN